MGSMAHTFFRIQDASHDPQTLLDPQTWQSTAWSVEPVTKTCPDCHGVGSVLDEDGYEDRCPVEVEDIRYGVSTCHDLDDLADYFRGRTEHGDEYIDQLVLVELEGELAEDDDHDEDDGACLVWPSRIVSVSAVPDTLRSVLHGEDD